MFILKFIKMGGRYDFDDLDMGDTGMLDAIADRNFNSGTMRGRQNRTMMLQLEAAEMEYEAARQAAALAEERLRAAAEVLRQMRSMTGGMMGGGDFRCKMKKGRSKFLNQPAFS